MVSSNVIGSSKYLIFWIDDEDDFNKSIMRF